MAIPTRTRVDAPEFVRRVKGLLGEFERSEAGSPIPSSYQRGALQAIEDACDQVESPAHQLEHGLHPWVAFAIMPAFALANAGVRLEGDIIAALTSPVTLGIIVGLVVGKQIGITGAAWLAVRLGIAERPTGTSWRELYGVGWLAGIGFTMSLFITPLAFVDPLLQTSAKVGILAASLIAGIVGYTILRLVSGGGKSVKSSDIEDEPVSR
jgi:NhaA family Na+:H+ antiporter